MPTTEKPEYDNVWKGEYTMADISQERILHIGIDPDLTASGVAMVQDGELTYLQSLTFFQLITLIECFPKAIYSMENVMINKPLFGKYDKLPLKVKLKIAQDVGKCKAAAILIQQKLEIVGCVYELITPLKGTAKKCKTDAKLFNRLTGWEGQSNPDKRDAAMLLYRYLDKSK